MNMMPAMVRTPWWFVGLTLLILAGADGWVHGGEPEPESEPQQPLVCQVRQPVGLCLSPDGSRLYVANRRSGSLSIVATQSGRVVAEPQVGRGLADVVAVADGRLLAVDRVGNALLLLEPSGDTVRVVARQAVAADPVSLVVTPDGGSCVVASLESRRLTFFDLPRHEDHGQGRVTGERTLDLPFSPRNMVLVNAGSKLVVADAFGGKLAVVDRERATLDSVRNLPAHNLRGFALTADGRTLIVAHQRLHRQARTDFEDVFWGRFVTSHVRYLNVDAVLALGSDEDLLRDSDLMNLGEPYSGAGDPASLVCGPGGSVVVALGGVGEVAVERSRLGQFRRYGVGTRPSALALTPGGNAVYVADAVGDQVALVDLFSGKTLKTIPLGPRPDPTQVERGERLFHDATLSLDGWMSCHSCHTDGHSNGQLGDTLGDGAYGAPKRVPSLRGVHATGPWTWTGSIDRLEDQIQKSVQRTMRGSELTGNQVESLTAYLRSLPPLQAIAAPSRHDAVDRGRDLFRSQGCTKCHTPPAYTSTGRYDVGLMDEAGNRKFNPPSLLGVGHREPLLHDGRAKTLEDVFLQHRHPQETELTPEEVSDLSAFLKTL
ncbi:40-residue YVTN family beta-propeller repeat-containing protein [Singulisphaera sp. GP187]|uniref:cytochrome c peroxidase n=1 Tax=Singulisphaera sp. GP187 TaxID=1882752 RepID=UPI00092BFC26|nr:cytochrome c peroxidase [Singulisphaera sp. GP187]SIO31038.1 40-residue YVTN family beta-propeller repeat-containing protein [Singulisphaera sp. GP187]